MQRIRHAALHGGANHTRRLALGLQAAYFLVTGVWPLFHRRSFETITGNKHDFWLVQTVGALVAVVGVVLGRATLAGRQSDADVLALAVGSAAALGAIESYYAATRRISSVYLADAALESALIAGLLWRRANRQELSIAARAIDPEASAEPDLW
jgi:hypothetical protein